MRHRHQLACRQDLQSRNDRQLVLPHHNRHNLVVRRAQLLILQLLLHLRRPLLALLVVLFVILWLLHRHPHKPLQHQVVVADGIVQRIAVLWLHHQDLRQCESDQMMEEMMIQWTRAISCMVLTLVKVGL